MAKKAPSASKFKQQARARAKKAAASANKRATHYGKGDKLMKQVSKTLASIAASHPNPTAKKQAKLALKKLQQAHTEFGSAGMCADGGNTFTNSD